MELSDNQNYQLIKLLEELVSRQAGVQLVFTPTESEVKAS